MTFNRLLYLTFAGCLAMPIASAADDDDARYATEQLQKGVILPLSEILERVRHVTGDTILEIEIEREDFGPVYEVYFLDPDGRRREIYVNAVSGEILMQKIDEDPDAHTPD